MSYAVDGERVLEFKVKEYISKEGFRISFYADFIINLAKYLSSRGILVNLLCCNFGETMIAFK